jgi:hypothetical protein
MPFLQSALLCCLKHLLLGAVTSMFLSKLENDVLKLQLGLRNPRIVSYAYQ